MMYGRHSPSVSSVSSFLVHPPLAFPPPSPVQLIEENDMLMEAIKELVMVGRTEDAQLFGFSLLLNILFVHRVLTLFLSLDI